MRKTMKNAIRESVQGLQGIGIKTTFTKKQLKELGVEINEVKITPNKIKEIRTKTNLSQAVFAQLLNVSLSSIRQWELGTRTPTGATQVLLELLLKEPHVLDFRVKRKVAA